MLCFIINSVLHCQLVWKKMLHYSVLARYDAICVLVGVILSCNFNHKFQILKSHKLRQKNVAF